MQRDGIALLRRYLVEVRRSLVKESRTEPEYESIDLFVEFKLDDDDYTFNLGDVEKLSRRLRTSNQKIRLELEKIGLTYDAPEHGKKVRGFTTSSNDRWFGPGSSPTHGGSGINIHGGLRWGKNSNLS